VVPAPKRDDAKEKVALSPVLPLSEVKKVGAASSGKSRILGCDGAVAGILRLLAGRSKMVLQQCTRVKLHATVYQRRFSHAQLSTNKPKPSHP
jgi:hypothetical protein